MVRPELEASRPSRRLLAAAWLRAHPCRTESGSFSPMLNFDALSQPRMGREQSYKHARRRVFGRIMWWLLAWEPCWRHPRAGSLRDGLLHGVIQVMSTQASTGRAGTRRTANERGAP